MRALAVEGGTKRFSGACAGHLLYGALTVGTRAGGSLEENRMRPQAVECGTKRFSRAREPRPVYAAIGTRPDIRFFFSRFI